jgi:beta-glucosidase
MISATVTNTGRMDGEEVVQLYIAYPGLTRRTPIRALKGFQRINLKKGESAKVSFELGPEQLMQVDEKGESYQPAGELSFSIGGGQPGEPGSTNGAGSTNGGKEKVLQGRITIKQ